LLPKLEQKVLQDSDSIVPTEIKTNNSIFFYFWNCKQTTHILFPKNNYHTPAAFQSTEIKTEHNIFKSFFFDFELCNQNWRTIVLHETGCCIPATEIKTNHSKIEYPFRHF
jgi:hypothetical protein